MNAGTTPRCPSGWQVRRPPALADTDPTSLQRDADALYALGITGVLARLETRAGVTVVRDNCVHRVG